MKKSPLKISGFKYPTVSVKANPEVDPPEGDYELNPEVEASVGFNENGEHFAIISVKQARKSEHYTFEIEAFTTFKIDVDACRECYPNGWSPATLAVNMARLLYSGVRECLATITSRAPYGYATLPSTTLGPEDVQIEFEPSSESRDAILLKFFDFSKERIEELNRRMAEAKKNSRTGRSTRQPKKTTKAIKEEVSARKS